MQNQIEICELVNRGIQLIVEKQDWSFFDEFVLCSKSHPGQLEFLEKSIFKENALHPGNGFGKTAVIARKHLYFILKHLNDGKKYKTLNAAITQEQSELVQDEIIQLVENSPVLNTWLIESVVKFPQPKVKYINGAMTEFKTTKKKGESIEGKEYGYISVDEIALEPHLEFLRDKILLPRLRRWTDSQADYSATPKGHTAWYRIVNTIKRSGGYVRGGSSYENPHIDHALLDYQTRTWSDEKVRQVIHGEFIDTSAMMFASRVSVLFDESLVLDGRVHGGDVGGGGDVVGGGVVVDGGIDCVGCCVTNAGGVFVEGWDLARGRKKSADLTVGIRIKKGNPFVIKKYWAFQLPWTEKERDNINNEYNSEIEKSSIEREIRNAQKESNSDCYIDSTGIGDTLYGMLQDVVNPVDFRGGNKDRLLDHCQSVIDAGLLKSPFIPELADQMTMYQRVDTLLETDYLMALVVACSAIPIVKPRKIRTNSVELSRRF